MSCAFAVCYLIVISFYAFNACSISAMISSAFSIPTDNGLSRDVHLLPSAAHPTTGGEYGWRDAVRSTCVGHMGYDADEFQPVHKFYRFLTGSVQAESDDTARAVWHVFLCQIIVFVAFQSAIVHPFHFRVGFQPFGHFLCVFAMTGHAQV